MNLTEKPDTLHWPESHYVYIERIGPFQENAPAAWAELHKLLPALAEHNQITAYFSRYQVETHVYRAGVGVAAPPADLPAGLAYEKVPGGKYSRFVLTGPYPNLGPATGRAFELAAQLRLPLRKDFNIENYVNDPRITPEEELITEILFPIE
jgi:effector-binding domain-containing protein